MVSAVFDEIEGTCSTCRGEELWELCLWKRHINNGDWYGISFFGGYRAEMILPQLQME